MHRRSLRLLGSVAILFGCGMAGDALADPCEANVAGYREGATVAGVVRYVGDGDSLCIGSSPNPDTWIEIRLADLYAPELNSPGGRAARETLIRFARGQHAVCIVRRGNNGRTSSYDRLIARCSVRGINLAEAMRGAGVVEGNRGKR